MPVLSEQIAEVAPSVSVERSRLMIALASASSRVPRDRIVVTTAGSPVGIAAIANATATVKTSVKLWPRAMLSTTEATSASAGDRDQLLGQLLQLDRQRRLATRPGAWSIPEMWPTSVAMPVAVTTNSPVPRVTLVFM